MRFTAARATASIFALPSSVRLPSASMIARSDERTSPDRMIRCVVTIVSHATRASGSVDRNRSTTASEIWSATLSGWPSDTDSEVNRNESRMRVSGRYKESFISA